LKACTRKTFTVFDSTDFGVFTNTIIVWKFHETCNKFASLYVKNLSLGPPEPVEVKAMRMNTSFTANNGQDEILHGVAAAKP
jgi:hypothetical protein